MSGRGWTALSGDRRWRKPVLIGVSVGLHGVVLAVLIASGVGDRMTVVPTPPQPIFIEIEPRPLLEDERPRPRPTPAPSSAAESPPAPSSAQRSVMGLRLPFQRNRDEEEDRPSPPAPRYVAPAPGAPTAPTGAEAWQVRPETMGDRVGRGLRTRGPGCASPQLLSRQEQQICEERFGERAAAAPPIRGSGNPERDGEFARQGARALAEYEARRRPLSGGIGVVGPQDGPGSNFGIGVAGAHLDPSLRPDSTTNVRTRRDRIRETEED